jgi:hypothetical protein
MAAASTTGTGVGSAEGKNKGSESASFGVSHLIGTRIVAADRVTLAGGVATVTFPVPLTGDKANYIVICNALNSATVARPTVLTNDASGNFASFAVAGGATDVLYYMVAKVGFNG